MDDSKLRNNFVPDKNDVVSELQRSSIGVEQVSPKVADSGFKRDAREKKYPVTMAAQCLLVFLMAGYCLPLLREHIPMLVNSLTSDDNRFLKTMLVGFMGLWASASVVAYLVCRVSESKDEFQNLASNLILLGKEDLQEADDGTFDITDLMEGDEIKDLETKEAVIAGIPTGKWVHENEKRDWRVLERKQIKLDMELQNPQLTEECRAVAGQYLENEGFPPPPPPLEGAMSRESLNSGDQPCFDSVTVPCQIGMTQLLDEDGKLLATPEYLEPRRKEWLQRYKDNVRMVNDAVSESKKRQRDIYNANDDDVCYCMEIAKRICQYPKFMFTVFVTIMMMAVIIAWHCGRGYMNMDKFLQCPFIDSFKSKLGFGNETSRSAFIGIDRLKLPMIVIPAPIVAWKLAKQGGSLIGRDDLINDLKTKFGLGSQIEEPQTGLGWIWDKLSNSPKLPIIMSLISPVVALLYTKSPDNISNDIRAKLGHIEEPKSGKDWSSIRDKLSMSSKIAAVVMSLISPLVALIYTKGPDNISNDIRTKLGMDSQIEEPKLGLDWSSIRDKLPISPKIAAVMMSLISPLVALLYTKGPENISNDIRTKLGMFSQIEEPKSELDWSSIRDKLPIIPKVAAVVMSLISPLVALLYTKGPENISNGIRTKLGMDSKIEEPKSGLDWSSMRDKLPIIPKIAAVAMSLISPLVALLYTKGPDNISSEIKTKLGLGSRSEEPKSGLDWIWDKLSKSPKIAVVMSLLSPLVGLLYTKGTDNISSNIKTKLGFDSQSEEPKSGLDWSTIWYKLLKSPKTAVISLLTPLVAFVYAKVVKPKVESNNDECVLTLEYCDDEDEDEE